MTSIHGHFDGKAVVLDELPPPAWVKGQRVRIVVDASAADEQPATPRKSRFGFAKGMIDPSSTPHADPSAELMHGQAFDERDALHIDPLDAVPSDFVRRPGSGAGEIKMSDDFDQTPAEFKEYL